MAFGLDASAVIGGLFSMSAADSAAESADRQMAQQERLEREQMAYNRENQAKQDSRFGGLIDSVVKEVMSTDPSNDPDYIAASNMAEVNKSENVQDLANRATQGSPYATGLNYNAMQNINMRTATDLTNNYIKSLATNKTNRLNLIPAAVTATTGATVGVNNAFTTGINNAQRGSERFAAMAQDGYSSAGELITKGLTGAAMYSAMNKPPVTPPTPQPATQFNFADWASDRRLKRNVEFLQNKDNLNIYKFQYLWSDEVYVGVMAQDLIGTENESAVRTVLGFYVVNYSKLGINMMTFGEWSNKHSWA